MSFREETLHQENRQLPDLGHQNMSELFRPATAGNAPMALVASAATSMIIDFAFKA
jgi:hypothetical protein